jgi:prolyl-tRNA synthetase
MANKSITSRDVDFAKWYTDVVKAARLARYSNVKGCIVIEPNGYAIWEKMVSVLDKMFKETGHQNVSMPLLIPETLLNKESELVEGFAPEVAWVTQGGNNVLEERLCIRPTSESLFSDYYSEVVKSYRDLPLKYNQWCNVLRWEKETRPFLRSREFLWQEGHTVHETKEEAEAETKSMMEVYKTLFHDYLAIPAMSGIKTEKEKFAGAEYTLTLESLMYNGVSLQSGTSHFFGQKFSKAYGISFKNRNNEDEYAYQTSWGASTRMIGGLIMVHSDDDGLVLPPNIAPRQVVIVPITNDKEILALSNEINKELNDNLITSYIDDTDKSAGFKFAEAEVNGIPVRIEIGLRDLEQESVTVYRRDKKEKELVKLENLNSNYIKDLMKNIQDFLYNKALERTKSMTYKAHNTEEIKTIMDKQPGFIYADWCGSEDCELALKEIKGIKSRCIMPNEEFVDGKCVVCGKEAKHVVVWGIQY